MCSIVGISTYYWLESPGCDTQWRQGIFCEISGFRHDIYEKCPMTKNSAILNIFSLHQKSSSPALWPTQTPPWVLASSRG